MTLPETITIGTTTLAVLPRVGFGLVLTGEVGMPGPSAYLDGILADSSLREALWQLVDEHGVVVARNLRIDRDGYRGVRGKRARKRMSQGEFFHHDGCSTPIKPRVVEIRCPNQRVARSMGTSVAAFPAVVETMLRLLPETLRRTEALQSLHESVLEGRDDLDWENAQGELNRVLRLVDPELARAFFADVDAVAVGFFEPWTVGESRFIANRNDGRTAQHRRACAVPWVVGVPNGRLMKRWPAEELEGEAADCDVCARSGD